MLHVTNKPSKPLYLIIGCLSFLLLLILNSGCGCGDEYEVDVYFNCKIFNKDSESNLFGWNGSYSEDSLKIILADGHAATEASVSDGDGIIYFGLIEKGEFPKTENTKLYFLQLTNTDVDTILVNYSFTREGRCDDIVNLESITVTYNDSLYTTTSNGLFEFYKK